MKNTRSARIAALFVAVLVIGSASSASALSVAEIQAQIQFLLGQIAALGQSAGQTQSTVVGPVSQQRICMMMYRNLSFGSRGDDVVALQEFLRSEGYLSANATGYFGPATRAALARWQASQGIAAVGALGPMTRERIGLLCGEGGGGGIGVCTKEYRPVCGAKPIVCITTPCNPIQQTYGNRCMMLSDGATFLYEGSCRDTSTNPENDPRCKTWDDACHTWVRDVPGGRARTLPDTRTCASSQYPLFCKEYFDDSDNKAPTISSFSGPTSLAVNASGTWTIQASDPENGQLTYDIRWGDEGKFYRPNDMVAVNVIHQTTFTHAYSSAGTYTVSVVVRDAAGQEARTTSTVRIGSEPTYCTMEYAPVCGQPPEPACRHSIPACMMPDFPPQTYGNRCVMNAAGATFLYAGQCSGTY